MTALLSTNGVSTPHGSEPTPSAPSPTGKDAQGRFTKGNRGGPGNPFAKQAAALRKALYDSVTEEDIRYIVGELLTLARLGDKAAIKLLFSYIIGKPTTPIDPDAVELDPVPEEHPAPSPTPAAQSETSAAPNQPREERQPPKGQPLQGQTSPARPADSRRQTAPTAPATDELGPSAWQLLHDALTRRQQTAASAEERQQQEAARARLAAGFADLVNGRHR
jgi:hypothetical protein